MDLQLRGMTGIVTGSASGIGSAIAQTLRREGSEVFGVDLEAGDGAGDGRYLVLGDIAEPKTAQEAVAVALNETGRIDVLVNCAGVVRQQTGFMSVSPDEWHSIWRTNVLGSVLMTRAVIPSMLERGGSIVHVSSARARFPIPQQVEYATTKAALLSLSKSLAREFGRRGIRSNVVSPGSVRTPMWDRPGGIGDVLAARHGLPKDEAIEYELSSVRDIPAGRAATPGEVAVAVAFLASPVSAYTNGAELLVDGAMTPTT